MCVCVYTCISVCRYRCINKFCRKAAGIISPAVTCKPTTIEF